VTAPGSGRPTRTATALVLMVLLVGVRLILEHRLSLLILTYTHRKGNQSGQHTLVKPEVTDFWNITRVGG